MPHALYIQANGSIAGFDRSRAQQDDGTPGPGWVFVTPEQFAAAQALTDPTWIGEDVVNNPPGEEPVVPPVLTISKLKLTRALRAVSPALEDAFYAALEANPQWSRDWLASSVLESDDPMLLAALPALAAVAGLTVEQARGLLESAAV
jgi:hypothetical protein